MMNKFEENNTELKYKSFFDNSRDGIVLVQKDGKILDCNNSYCKMLGYTYEELTNMNFYQITPGKWHKWEKEEIIDKKLIKHGFTEIFEKEYIKKDGTIFPVELTAYTVKIENDEILFIWAVVRDISQTKKHESDLLSAREKAEERECHIQQIANNLANGMIYQIISADNVQREFTYVSNTVSKFYGCSPEDVKNNPSLIYNKVHPDDIQRLIEEEKEAYRTMLTFNTIARIINPDGDIRWSSFTSTPRKHNGLIYWDGIEIDITEQKKTELELIEAKVRAEEGTKLKTSFLQNLTHEIKTPMNAIIGFSKLLETPGLSNEKRQSYSKIIINSSNQLLSIINDVLTLSSIETNNEKTRIEEISIIEILNELYAIFLQKAEIKQLILEMKYQINEINVKVFSDKTKIQQIFTNLLNNALKFTHTGLIEFGCKRINSYIEFYVKDTGIGIDKDNQEKIFERFAQADQTIQVNYGGTGLGLSICKGFVELLGGAIRVESEINKGSIFYFTIPS